jgi:hypothetical protein
MGKQIKKKIKGTEYTFQKLTAMEWIRLKERSQDENGRMRDSLYFKEIAEHVIVDPKLDLEVFEDAEELTEIMEVATFLHIKKKK